MQRFQRLLVVLVLLVASILAFTSLTRLPPGFNNDEIANINIAETVRMGKIATFYNVQNKGYEGLYPILEAGITGVIGDGLLCYRILSVWCGLLSVALAYALTRRLFGGFAGLIAALTLAVSLWPVILSRSAVPETLLLPLIFTLLWALTQAFHLRREIMPGGSPATLTFALLGLLITLAAYIHWTGLMAPVLVGAFLLYLILTHQPISRRVIGFTGFALVVAITAGIPYLIFTLRAPSLSGFNTLWENRPESLGTLLHTTLAAILGLFANGDLSATHNMWGGGLIGPIGGVLLLVGIVIAIQYWRWPASSLMLLTLVIGIAPAAWSRGNLDFAKMVFALPAVVALTGLGAATVAKAILKLKSDEALLESVRLLLFSAVLTLAAFSFTVYQLHLWGDSPEVDAAYQGRLGRLAIYLDRTHDNLTTSICTLNLDGDDQHPVSDPALLEFMMHGKSDNLRFSNCLDGLVITRGGELQRFAYADPAAPGSVSPILKDWLKGAEPVDVAGLPTGTVFQLDMTQQVADLGGQLQIEPVKWDPQTPGSSVNASLPLRMGGYLTFKGYQLIPGKTLKLGDTLNVVTYWRADGDQQPNLRIFVHMLIDPTAKPVLQNDLLSVRSELLQNRDVFIQVTPLPIPTVFPTGDYYLSVGAYHDQGGTQERLPVYDQDQERGNRLFLDTITVLAVSK